MKNTIFNKVVLKFCLLGALDRFMLIYSVYIMFFAKIGLNPATIGLILAFYEIGKILSDSVFAALADKHGRKNLICIGFLFKACGISLWVIFPGVISAFVGVFLIGIGKSGTNNIDSYMYDELKANNYEKYFKSAIAMKSIVTNISASIGGYASSVLYTIGNFEAVFLAAIFVILFISIPYILFFLKDSKLYITENQNKSILYVAKNGFLVIKNNRKIFYSIILVAIFYSAYIMYTDTNKMIMNDIGFSPDLIAKIYSVAHIIPAITTTIFLIFRPGILIRGIVVLTMIIWISIAVSAYILYGKPLVAVILVYLFMFPIFDSCIKDNLHRVINNSSVRATILSFSSLLSSFINIISSILIGFIANKYSYQVSIVIFSILISSTVFIIMVVQRFKVMKKIIS